MVARNTLKIEGGNLIVIPTGWDKFWGFRRQIKVRLSSITEVSVETDPRHVPIGIRAPGLYGFGKCVGTYYTKRERHYWNYSNASGVALSIRLDGSEYFRQMYLSVEDAEEAKRLISNAMTSNASE